MPRQQPNEPSHVPGHPSKTGPARTNQPKPTPKPEKK